MTNEPNSNLNSPSEQVEALDTASCDDNATSGGGDENALVFAGDEPGNIDSNRGVRPAVAARRLKADDYLPTAEKVRELVRSKKQRANQPPNNDVPTLKRYSSLRMPKHKVARISKTGVSDDDQVLDRKVQNCVDAVAALDEAQDTGELLNHRVMVQVMHLFEYSKAHPEAVKQVLKARGIRTTGASRNPFTPLMNLAFGTSKSKRSSVSRNSAALRFASDSNVAASELSEYIRENGGVVECAKLDRARYPSQASARAEEKRAALLKSRRETAVIFHAPALQKTVTSKFATLFVETLKGGQFRLLGTRDEADSVITRYSPKRGQ